jgi:hypothetical protein
MVEEIGTQQQQNSGRKYMFGLDRVGILVACIVFLAPSAAAQNLARYREFEFRMSVDAVAK